MSAGMPKVVELVVLVVELVVVLEVELVVVIEVLVLVVDVVLEVDDASICTRRKHMLGAFGSGGSNRITFVPLTNEFEKTDIGIHSVRLVEYIGVIVPVGGQTAQRVTSRFTLTITGGGTVVSAEGVAAVATRGIDRNKMWANANGNFQRIA